MRPGYDEDDSSRRLTFISPTQQMQIEDNTHAPGQDNSGSTISVDRADVTTQNGNGANNMTGQQHGGQLERETDGAIGSAPMMTPGNGERLAERT